MSADFRPLALLDAIRAAFLQMEPLLADPRLSGIRVTIKLNQGSGAVRSTIVEPELRFESTRHSP